MSFNPGVKQVFVLATGSRVQVIPPSLISKKLYVLTQFATVSFNPGVKQVFVLATRPSTYANFFISSIY